MYCLPQEVKSKSLFGSFKSGEDYFGLDIMLLPCASRVTIYDGTVHGAEDECVWEQALVEDKIGKSIELVVYFNSEEFE